METWRRRRQSGRQTAKETDRQRQRPDRDRKTDRLTNPPWPQIAALAAAAPSPHTKSPKATAGASTTTAANITTQTTTANTTTATSATSLSSPPAKIAGDNIAPVSASNQSPAIPADSPASAAVPAPPTPAAVAAVYTAAAPTRHPKSPPTSSSRPAAAASHQHHHNRPAHPHIPVSKSLTDKAAAAAAAATLDSADEDEEEEEEEVEEDSESISEVSSISSASMDEEESWIATFCNFIGHEYFAEVSEDFIEDDFNLTGLGAIVPMYVCLSSAALFLSSYLHRSLAFFLDPSYTSLPRSCSYTTRLPNPCPLYDYPLLSARN